MYNKTTLIFLLVLISLNAFSQRYDHEELNKTSKKYDALMQLIEYFYVDKADKPKLTEDAIVAVLKSLDPHSVYITKEEAVKKKESLEGSFYGVGVQFQIVQDTVLIIAPIVGGPSEKVGIMAGDRIVKINDELAVGKKVNSEFVFQRLKGQKGTMVKLSIHRRGQKSLLDYTVKRDKIPLYSINAKYMLDNQTGYIKLSQFSRTSLTEFQEALSLLKAKGMNNLVLDLRNNPGGYMDIAYELLDEFLPSRKLGVYTKGLKSKQQSYYTTARGNFEDGKLIILVNEGSASSSEIVAGGVQDWDRGIIMGRRTFGKGLVQRPFMLPDSSLIHLTTARYYTPSGRNIQKPYIKGADEYELEIYKRAMHGEFMHADSIKFPDSLKYYTNAKRVVYGGGGIMPDYFIPIDTTSATPYYIEVSRKGYINEFRLKYVEENREALKKKYPNIDAYKKDETETNKMFEHFLKYAETKGSKPTPKDKEVAFLTLKTLLKALISQDLYGENSYYEVINAIDDELSKAKQMMYNTKAFEKLTKAN